MANVNITRRLVNSARRRKRRNPKLSLAQRLAGFGGKRRQTSALAGRRRKRRTNAAPRRWHAHRPRRNIAAGFYDEDGAFHPIRASHDYSPRRAGEGARKKRKTTRKRKPAAKRKTTAKRRTTRRRRKNPSEIIQLGLVNPAPRRKRRSNVAKRRKKNTSARRRRRNSARVRRSNPFYAHRRRNRSTTRRRRRNPSVRRHRRQRNPSMRGVTGLVTQAAWAIAGAVGSRAITQMVLKGNNVGVMGYGANAVAGLALAGAASKFANKAVGQAVLFGTVIGLVLRIIQEITPLGSYVQSTLAMSGLRGDTGVGFLQPTTFFVPLAPADGRGATSAEMALPAAVMRPTVVNGNGVSGLGNMSRFGGRSRF